MPKQPRLPKTSRSDGDRSPDTGYAIGYGKPPTHTQFRPGQTGNPKGRRRRQRNVRTVVEETLNQRITVREGERSRTLTKREALILTMVNGAIKGEPRALTCLLALLRVTGMVEEAPLPTQQESLTENDANLLADYLRRHGGEIAEANGDSTSTSPVQDHGTRNERRKA
jgi:hypothetical protein